MVNGTASVWWRAGKLRVSGALVGRLARQDWVSTRRVVLDGAVELTDAGAVIGAPRSRWSPKIAARYGDGGARVMPDDLATLRSRAAAPPGAAPTRAPPGCTSATSPRGGDCAASSVRAIPRSKLPYTVVGAGPAARTPPVSAGRRARLRGMAGCVRSVA